MSIRIKVLVDDAEIPLPDGVVKVIVEGLGLSGDYEMHTAFTHEGCIEDVVKDGEIVDTHANTYGDLFAALFVDDEEEDDADSGQQPGPYPAG